MTTFGGLMPMILETSFQARMMIPMAISLGFGVLFATRHHPGDGPLALFDRGRYYPQRAVAGVFPNRWRRCRGNF